MSLRRTCLVAVFTAGLAACSMPDPRPTVSFATASGPTPATPRLIPLEGRLPDVRAGAPVAEEGGRTADLGAQLRRRGAAIRGPVISPAERARLEAAIARARAETGG